MCLKESCFPDCWKVLSVVPVLKNVGERCTAKNYCPVSLLSVVSNVLEKFINNGIVDQVEKCGILSLIHSMKFLSPEVVLYLYKSTISDPLSQECPEYLSFIHCFFSSF